MIYPKNFEDKIEFVEVRKQLKGRCLCKLGCDLVEQMSFSDNVDSIKRSLTQVEEFVQVLQSGEFPEGEFVDVRPTLWRIRIERTYLEVLELFDLQRSLRTIDDVARFLRNAGEGIAYPELAKLTETVSSSESLLRLIDKILDENGHVLDSASPQLSLIRNEQRQLKQRTSRLLLTILQNAQHEGLLESRIQPTMRDGRLVIPVASSLRRKIRGIVHDMSDTGKTLFIEPNEVVEANNKSSELEVAERKEIIRILTDISAKIRPHIEELLENYRFLAQIDFIRAKALFAIATNSVRPAIESDSPCLDWGTARHPLLYMTFKKKGRDEQEIVPLDIALSAPERRILLISGPNAGGKSVCLKTVALLQYMLQCGMLVPMGESSRCGIFRSMFIDIGDEQSMESDLSTYSSHLLNMKHMLQKADSDSLILIDELGSGTEPQMGGAIAEAVLRHLNGQGCYGIVTTHYQNLKHLAQNEKGLVNGAMLYDRQQMRPLFRLSIGSPGSSFAIDIAHKIGLPREVIQQAEEIVGSDYIQSDRYVQDILRDKRYWQDKRETIHKLERQLEENISKYEAKKEELNSRRNTLMAEAREQARNLLASTNATIEKTIKEIREAQADKERTKQIRSQLEEFRKSLEQDTQPAPQEQKKRTRKKKGTKGDIPAEISSAPSRPAPSPTPPQPAQPKQMNVGDYVRIKGQQTVGKVLKVNTNGEVLVAFGDIKTNIKPARLTPAQEPPKEKRTATFLTRETRDSIRETTLNFHGELNVIGMRADEALQAVTYFMDDATVSNVAQLRIVHGTGAGILKTLIRRYLSTLPAVESYHDDLPQFGGAGVTVVHLG